MSTVIKIMLDEWRYWWRSRLAVSLVVIGLVLISASLLVNTFDKLEANHEREHLQQQAEARFLEQPDRHPHRMVHYGHYVFRTPSPLSIIEPGVDAYTGTAIFLEGHRQNTAMFAEQQQSSGLTRFSSLSPAFMMQVIAPLLLVLVGYACITRERESGTLNLLLTQGVRKYHLILGKYCALVGSGLLLLLPLAALSLWATVLGESLRVAASFVLGYFVYILIWSALVLWVSSLSVRSHTSFATLLLVWVALCILVPRMGSSSAASLAPSPGKLETDFAVLNELRKLGDGHNAADPAFATLKSQLLAQYNVDDIADLPVNFRGVVAKYAENQLTDVLNQFAQQRMQQELYQAQIARHFGWLSPMVAMRSLSTTLAATHLENHHRFLRQAEALRFDFVQSLNQIHQEQLDYSADKNRYRDKETAQAARVDASNWEILQRFSFTPQPEAARLQQSWIYAAQLIFWCSTLYLLTLVASRRLN